MKSEVVIVVRDGVAEVACNQDEQAVFVSIYDMDNEPEREEELERHIAMLNGDEPEPTEPDPEDFCMGPAGPLLSMTSLWVSEGPHIGIFKTTEEAVRAIRYRMRRNMFYPNVWELSDHGNLRLVNLSEEYPIEGPEPWDS